MMRGPFLTERRRDHKTRVTIAVEQLILADGCSSVRTSAQILRRQHVPLSIALRVLVGRVAT